MLQFCFQEEKKRDFISDLKAVLDTLFEFVKIRDCLHNGVCDLFPENIFAGFSDMRDLD